MRKSKPFSVGPYLHQGDEPSLQGKLEYLQIETGSEAPLGTETGSGVSSPIGEASSARDHAPPLSIIKGWS